jgi:hypothetical protein
MQYGTCASLFKLCEAKRAICPSKPKTISQGNIDPPLLRMMWRIIAVEAIRQAIQINSRRHNTL